MNNLLRSIVGQTALMAFQMEGIDLFHMRRRISIENFTLIFSQVSKIRTHLMASHQSTKGRTLEYWIYIFIYVYIIWHYLWSACYMCCFMTGWNSLFDYAELLFHEWTKYIYCREYEEICVIFCSWIRPNGNVRQCQLWMHLLIVWRYGEFI